MLDVDKPLLPVRLWERLWLLPVFVLITFGTITLNDWLVARIIFDRHPSEASQRQVFLYASCWIVSLVFSGWILFRRKMSEGDAIAFFAAFGSALIVVAGVVLGTFLIVLIQSLHRP